MPSTLRPFDLFRTPYLVYKGLFCQIDNWHFLMVSFRDHMSQIGPILKLDTWYPNFKMKDLYCTSLHPKYFCFGPCIKATKIWQEGPEGPGSLTWGKGQKFHFKTYLLTPWPTQTTNWNGLNNFDRGPHRDHSCEVWSNSHKWLKRRWNFPYINQCKIVTPGAGSILTPGA